MHGFVCLLEEVPDGGARSCIAGDSDVVILREGESVYAYENVCPHQGRPMSWAPGRFLVDREARLLVCANHGAAFRIRDGVCVSGPCAGAGLHAVPVKVEHGAISVDTSE